MDAANIIGTESGLSAKTNHMKTPPEMGVFSYMLQ